MSVIIIEISVPGKVCVRVLIERLIEVIEVKICEEQGGLRKGKGCVDQIFAIKIMLEEYLGKGDIFYVAFMNLENVCES